jgi:hypothetical protein
MSESRKGTWILALAFAVLAGLVGATVFVLRSPAYHARFVSESEISLFNDRVVARGHARALLDAKARDEILPRALEERDPDWKFRALAIALVTTETKASEDELRVLVRCLDGGPMVRWPAIIALDDLEDPRTLDALTARALALREQIETLPPAERWHPRGEIEPIPIDRELHYLLHLTRPALNPNGDPFIHWDVTLEEVRHVRATFEERRATLPPQVLPR